MKYTNEQKIGYALREIGIHQDLKGYQYLKMAILGVLEKPDMLDRMVKDIYPYVAKKFNTNSSCVERAIRHAIETSWLDTDDEIIHLVFGNSISKDTGRPTNSHFIFAIAEIITDYEEHALLPKG